MGVVCADERGARGGQHNAARVAVDGGDAQCELVRRQLPAAGRAYAAHQGRLDAPTSPSRALPATTRAASTIIQCGRELQNCQSLSSSIRLLAAAWRNFLRKEATLKSRRTAI